MSRPRTLDELLAGARPADPSGRDADAASVRVLARFASACPVAGDAASRSSAKSDPSDPSATRRRARQARLLALASAGVVAVAIVGAAIGFGGFFRGDGASERERDGAAASVARDDGHSVPASAGSAAASSNPGAVTPANYPSPEASARALAEAAASFLNSSKNSKNSNAASPPPQDALGPGARERWLALAEAGGADAVDALRSLVRAGGPAGATEARRVAALHVAASLSSVVREVLASAPGDAGPAALADLLLVRRGAGVSARDGDAASERAIVVALEGVADGGREALAMTGLRRAADAGSVEAALACLRRGGSGELDRALAAVSADLAESVGGVSTADDPTPAVARLAEIVRAQSKTLGAALERRVARGEIVALAVATAGRFDWVVSTLRPRLLDPTGGLSSVEAVGALAAVGGASAWEALASVAGTPDAPGATGASRAVVNAATAALAALPPEAADVFAAAAVREAGARAAPYLSSLASMGDVGLARLAALADRPALAASVVHALSTATSPRANSVLASLGERAGLALPVVESLTARLARGDRAASDALLSLARGSASRAALDALAGAGPAGAASLASALADPRLRPAAEAAMRRESSSDGKPPAGRPPAAGPPGIPIAGGGGPRVPDPVPNPGGGVRPTPGAARPRPGR